MMKPDTNTQPPTSFRDGRLSYRISHTWLIVFILLLRHQQLHDNLSGVGDGGAGTEDGSDAGFVEDTCE